MAKRSKVLRANRSMRVTVNHIAGGQLAEHLGVIGFFNERLFPSRK
jgi:hypothetical protein